jgi:hypothetical protein
MEVTPNMLPFVLKALCLFRPIWTQPRLLPFYVLASQCLVRALRRATACVAHMPSDSIRHMDVKAGEVVAVQGIGVSFLVVVTDRSFTKQSTYARSGRKCLSAVMGTPTKRGFSSLSQHLGILFCRAMGYRTVALSSSASKESLAAELGAHDYIDGSKVDQADTLQKLGGAKVKICDSLGLAELTHNLYIYILRWMARFCFWRLSKRSLSPPVRELRCSRLTDYLILCKYRWWANVYRFADGLPALQKTQKRPFNSLTHLALNATSNAFLWKRQMKLSRAWLMEVRGSAQLLFPKWSTISNDR